ncbi:MAG: peptidoglycan DD-metalloendopeptidase family protein [Gammaproteobacteria bacterium]|nr:peptidoglycan DD-metalloendopeptidase family protein [Gammaproteobacteria bacterium]
MKWHAQYLSALLLIILFSGCAKPRHIKLPPVTEGWHKSSAVKNAYIVQPKDTLYSIAWAFGVDYRYLATINNIKPPYALRRGQRLHIASSVKPRKKKQARAKIEFVRDVTNIKPIKGWSWPTVGKVISNFNNKNGGNKGIDIMGRFGQPILASNQGEVVYSGVGIRSYGKLIIIKHNDDYLSAYAYNKQMLVAEGQKIKVGQKIATMGYDNDERPCLHFEVRRFGKPVNPLLYLPRKP